MNKNTNNHTTSVVAIISHGLSDNSSSSFIRTMAKKIRDLSGVIPITHDFSFARKKLTPSSNLYIEVEDLKAVIDESIKKYAPDSIFLIGKSLGGLVSLAYRRKYAQEPITAVFILGFPFKLGYPPRLNLLSESNPVLPDYFSEYRDLLRELKVPIFIVQGDGDDLGDVQECKELCGEFSNCSMEVIDNASHGFTDVYSINKTFYEECSNLVADDIKKLTNRTG